MSKQAITTQPADRGVLLIAGYGSGISHALAQRFGCEGYAVALAARRQERLVHGVEMLAAQGTTARGFVANLGEEAAVRRLIADVRVQMGGIAILHWNAYTDCEGNLLTADIDLLRQSLAVRVGGYVAAVQEALPDLQARRGCVLATSGVMGLDQPHINAFAQDFGVLAVSVAAQRKATALLAQTLSAQGIYVGEVVVNGFVQHSEGAAGHQASVSPDAVAEQFWQMTQQRQTHSLLLGTTV